MRSLYFFIFAVCLLAACIETPNQYPQLPPGKWRAYMKLGDNIPGENTSSADVEANEKLEDYFELPFNFEVSYAEDGEMKVVFTNADERIEASSTHYGRDPRTAKDTLEIRFDDYDTYFDGYYEENYIEGYWKVPYRGENYRIPFLATYGQDYRYELPRLDTNYDFSGKWKVEFNHGKENAYPAIAEFSQSGTELTGTFMTETGDYRYLQGNVSGEKMKLSVFDGAHAFLFSAKVSNDTILGEFRSGSHYQTNWIATRDDKFALKDAYEMTKAESSEAIDFSFEALNGQNVSLSDPEFEGKIKLVNLMGTWCPNCKDEIEFLKEVKQNNPDVAIISIAFEKYKDKDKAFEILRRYKKTRGVDWPLLYGGYANKKENSEALEFIDQLYAYPTLLIVDSNNRIVDIQTGFYGPATSQYQEFKNKFYGILNNLQS